MKTIKLEVPLSFFVNIIGAEKLGEIFNQAIEDEESEHVISGPVLDGTPEFQPLKEVNLLKGTSVPHTTYVLADEKFEIPWDPRIHTDKKTKTKDGKWRLKRGVSKELVAQVEKELSLQKIPPSPPTETTLQPDVKQKTPPSPPIEAILQPDVKRGAPISSVSNFPSFVQAVVQKGLDQEKVISACQKYGCSSIQNLSTQPDLIPFIATELGI